MSNQCLCLCFFLLCMLPAFGGSYKILGLFSHVGKSHYLAFERVLLSLSEKGHSVTSVSFFPQKKPPPQFTDISLQNLSLPGVEVMEVDMSGSRLIKYGGIHLIEMFADMTCEPILSSPQIQAFLKGDLNFDLIIVEFFNSNCLMSLAEKVNAPMVALSSCVVMPFWHDNFGNPNNPAYIPVMFMDYSDQLSFFERVENFVMLVYTNVYFKFVMNPKIQKVVDKYVSNARYIEETSRKVSLMLVNSHWSVSRPKPYVPNVIEVGGMHLPPLNSLPTNLEKWINESTHGVIYFSMGSLIKGTTFPEEKRKMFLRVFKRLPQRVLWKYESDNMPGKPDNVMIQRWMPQYDILCHPNVKAFVSHGGMLGTTETVQCGVPVLVMPQFGDQFTNAKAIEASGGGIIFDFWKGDEETLYNSLLELLQPGFQKQAQQLSARFRDRPLPPLETAIYWVEYVARHGGAHHMRTAAVDMPLYKYLLLDVIFFLVAVLLSFLWITYTLCKFVVGKIVRRTTKIKTS